MVTEATIYHVSDEGLAPGHPLGRIGVYLCADYDKLAEENARLRGSIHKARELLELCLLHAMRMRTEEQDAIEEWLENNPA